MLKKIIGLSSFLVVSVISLSFGYVAVDGSYPTKDQWALSRMKNGQSTTTIRVDFYGNLLPGENNTNDIGESSHAYKAAYINDVYSKTGLISYKETWLDPVAKSQVGVFQGITISSDSLVQAGTTYITADLTQPTFPRNIVVFTSITLNGVAITTGNITGTAIVKGVDSLGNSNTETLAVVSTANATAGLGNIAWATISSVTIRLSVLSTGTIVGAVLIQNCIGTGDKLGLVNDLNVVGDMYKAVEAGVDKSSATSTTVNTTYSTYQPISAVNGSNDYELYYKINKRP